MDEFNKEEYEELYELDKCYEIIADFVNNYNNTN